MLEDAIAVFDSGFGGISVLAQLMKEMPHEHFCFYGDSAFAPYGEKDKETIKQRCFTIVDYFMQCKAKAIVIACNTATSACVNELRQAYDIPIIGMEPALKPAVINKKHQRVVVMATPFTLKEKKFANLMQCFEKEHEIIKLPTPKLVRIVEENRLDDVDYIKKVLQDYFNQIEGKVDSIVLGCTHFVFFKDIIRSIVDEHIEIYDGNLGTAKHVVDILNQKGNLRISGELRYEIENSMNDVKYIELSEKLLFNQLR